MKCRKKKKNLKINLKKKSNFFKKKLNNYFKKKGFTLVELLSVIAILAILVAFTMPNIVKMFNQAKVDTFVTDVQKIMEASSSQFTQDVLKNAGKSVYYSSVDNDQLDTSKLNLSSDKEYFIEMDRHGEFKRIVVYDKNYCYDVYSSDGSGDVSGTNSKLISEERITKSSVLQNDVFLSGDDKISIEMNGEKYFVKGCDGKFAVDGSESINLNPDDGSEPVVGDEYKYGDYTYAYKKLSLNSVDYYGWEVSINEDKIDRNQSTYGVILESINGKPIISLQNTFKNCVNLTSVSNIPSTVVSMANTFYGCTSLVNAPVLPSELINMTGTFYGCTSLVSSPVIPNKVYAMATAFYGCTSLVNASFIPNSVMIMQQTFQGCTSLKSAPVIPESVKILNALFSGCTSLSGTVVINSIPVQASSVFLNVDFKTQNIKLEGTSPYLDTIGKTGLNYCDECDGKCHTKHMITFTVAGVEYQAEKNMTWGQWYNSEYNTDSKFFYHNQLMCMFYDGARIVTPEGGQTSYHRVIQDGEVYR